MCRKDTIRLLIAGSLESMHNHNPIHLSSVNSLILTLVENSRFFSKFPRRLLSLIDGLCTVIRSMNTE